MTMRLPVLIAALLLTALPAAAQIRDFPNLLPQAWEAEAQGMDDKSLGLLLPCGINRITANLRLSNPARRPQIVPAAGMIFAITPPQIEQVILQIEADADGKPALMLKKHGGAQVMKDIRFAAPVAYGKDVAVTVRWHPDGRIDVTAGGRTQSMTLSKSPADVEFIVQGGKGNISNLRTAWEGGGQAAACARPLR
jgi:hypothetical protein